MKEISGGITAPSGFKASGISCGIKRGSKKDLTLIYSIAPAAVAGFFTTNKVWSASIEVTRRHLKRKKTQAIIVNSGNANCCTGQGGIDQASLITRLVARRLNLREEEVLIASTGIIGKPLPIEKIGKAIPTLVDKLDEAGSSDAAISIMTTDKVPKQLAVQLEAGGKVVTIGAIAKGSGMISPHMATMLAFLTTDALIAPNALKKAFKRSVESSFNSITVDGCMSTNDMALVLANGLAGNAEINIGDEDFHLFCDALEYVCFSLAKMIVKDGEGATKFVEISVEGAKRIEDARKVAFKVANSNLVKTALFGEDPNWGRIAAAVGASDVDFEMEQLDLWIGETIVLRGGVFLRKDKSEFKPIFEADELKITIDLNQGRFSARVCTCDLSKEYVEINSKYEK